ncbi:MAG: hypothetical protein V4628_11905 [Pseudomonadota bacterium]
MSDANTIVQLSASEKLLLVETKATCPFLAGAVNESKLPVRNTANDPLASIEDVRALGNTGGGDLGDLLVFFASGNHAFMRGESGKLDKEVPAGLFSLELPGSQGSHPGHSGILQGDPALPGSGRLSATDFMRLTSRATNGYLKRSDVGRFIGENLFNDPHAKVFWETTGALLSSGVDFVQTTGAALMSKLFDSDDETETTHRDVEQKLTKLLGVDNLVGSAGEFGLLFAFLVNKPGTQEIDDEPTISVQDLTAMFVDKRLPDGWETWKKSRLDWIKNTTALLISARKEYFLLKRKQ